MSSTPPAPPRTGPWNSAIRSISRRTAGSGHRFISATSLLWTAFSRGVKAGRRSRNPSCWRAPARSYLPHRIKSERQRRPNLRRDGPTASPGWARLPGKKGYWGAASASSLVENTGTPIPMNDEGLLRNIADADRVAPFQPWAKAVYEYRQRNLLKDDPFLRCLPPGGPRQFQTPHGFQFIEQRELGRILVLSGGETATGGSYILMGVSKVRRTKRFALTTAIRLAIGRKIPWLWIGRLQREVLVYERRPAAYRSPASDRTLFEAGSEYVEV